MMCKTLNYPSNIIKTFFQLTNRDVDQNRCNYDDFCKQIFAFTKIENDKVHKFLCRYHPVKTFPIQKCFVLNPQIPFNS